MNTKTQAAMSPQQLAAEMLPKLTEFSVAFVAGWVAAMILFHSVTWFHGTTAQHATAANAAVKQFFDHLHRLL